VTYGRDRPELFITLPRRADDVSASFGADERASSAIHPARRTNIK